jgi:multimeric flavodoxin WrbA
MKILAINASFRAERGYTESLSQLLLEGARQSGAECETVYLSKLKINHCLACDKCQQSARLVETTDHSGPDFELTCVYADRDDALLVFEKMRQADLIIYATPVYVFNISSLLKNFLERFYGLGKCDYLRGTTTGLLFHHIEGELMSKPFLPLIVCDNLEEETTATARRYFTAFSRFMEAEQRGILVRNGGTLTGFGSNADLANFPALSNVYAAYCQAGRELAELGRISGKTQRTANQEVLPVPFFNLIKRIRNHRLKEIFAQKSRELTSKLGKD